ncbi:MAG TPA: hypothetical protein VGH33_20095 [Isosphaeraceae bacterium]|jgi:hypothetical protein
MIELLAIPAWQTPTTTLAEWVAQLEKGGGPAVIVERESPQGAWIHLEAMGVHGFAVLAGPHVEAVNFEIQEPLSADVNRFLEEAAAAIGWEIHPDDPDDEDDD